MREKKNASKRWQGRLQTSTKYIIHNNPAKPTKQPKASKASKAAKPVESYTLEL